MKKIFIWLIIVLIFSSAYADSLSYSVDVVSRYIFRGVDLGHPVNFNDDQGQTYNNAPAIQPGLEYAMDSGLYLGVWSSFGLGSTSTERLDELDPYIGYDFSFGGVDYTVGYTYYTLPSIVGFQTGSLGGEVAPAKAAQNTDFYEVWLGATFPKIMFSPSVTHYNGHFQRSNTTAAYTDLGLILPSFLVCDTSLNFGFTGYAGARGQATLLTDVTLGLSKDVAIAGTNATAFVNYIGLISHPDLAANPDFVINDEDGSYEIVFGLSFGGEL